MAWTVTLATPTATSTYASSDIVCNMPGTIVAGDLLLAIAAHMPGSARNYTAPSGWTELAHQYYAPGNIYDIYVYAKQAAGSDTLTVTRAEGSSNATILVGRLDGWYGGTLSSAVEAGFTNIGLGGSYDPPSLDPAGWAAPENTLGFAFAMGASAAWSGTYPYASNNQTGGGSNDAPVVAWCTTESTAGSIDPGAFGSWPDQRGVVATIVVRPVAAGAAVQTLVPNADITTTNWAASTPTALYPMVDEASPGSDADYIYTETENAECELALSDGGAPAAGTRTLKVRTHSALTPVGSMIVTLMEGASVVQAFTTTVPVAASTYAYTVTGSVTDYGNLRVRVKSGA